mmetsp:Transcript_24722/g.60726  ORF Transcript_24722/g.60726 Transcript_24722/m.60726 type:complete len:319 (+) Transcript_24722:3654-4610(+)
MVIDFPFGPKLVVQQFGLVVGIVVIPKGRFHGIADKLDNFRSNVIFGGNWRMILDELAKDLNHIRAGHHGKDTINRVEVGMVHRQDVFEHAHLLNGKGGSDGNFHQVWNDMFIFALVLVVIASGSGASGSVSGSSSGSSGGVRGGVSVSCFRSSFSGVSGIGSSSFSSSSSSIGPQLFLEALQLMNRKSHDFFHIIKKQNGSRSIIPIQDIPKGKSFELFVRSLGSVGFLIVLLFRGILGVTVFFIFIEICIQPIHVQGTISIDIGILLLFFIFVINTPLLDPFGQQNLPTVFQHFNEKGMPIVSTNSHGLGDSLSDS